MAVNASAVLQSEDRGERILPMDENFFTAYRKTVIKPDEVISGVWIPHGKEVCTLSLSSFKQPLLFANTVYGPKTVCTVRSGKKTNIETGNKYDFRISPVS